MRKYARKTPGRPFQKGNSGRPRGSKNKTTTMVQALLDGEGEILVRKAIERALGGDSGALRLCLERIVPPKRERSVHFDLPPVSSATDAVKAMAALLAAVSRGELAPAEAAQVVQIVEVYSRVLTAADLENRLTKLEQEQRQC